MAWFVLVVAGLLEVVWASALKRAHEPLWLAIFLVSLTGSMLGLAYAVRGLPLGVAYAVWVGIGILGTAIVSVTWYGERLTGMQLLFLACIVAGIVGLRLTTANDEPPSTSIDARS